MRYGIAALLLFALLGAGAFWLWHTPEARHVTEPAGPATMPSVPKSNTIPAPPVAGAWSAIELRILELTNQARTRAQLNPLQREDILRKAALDHSEDMLDRHFFDHVNPSGEGPADRISRVHRTLAGTTGENIWDGSGDLYALNPDVATVIMDSWMQSAGHRANILRKEFTHLGVGVVVRGLEVRATQDFAHVRAYLNVPLPERVLAGTPVDLSTHGDPPPPEMFDLELLPEEAGRGGMKPRPIEGARLDAAPGRYRLRLYFPTSQNEFEIFGGPAVRIER